MQKVHIPMGKDKIPARAKRIVDGTTGQIREIVSAPHYKGSYIQKANEMFKRGEITKEVLTRIIEGFFR